MSSKFIDVLNNVNAGRAGDNKGIPIPFPRLKQYFPNIQKGVYHLCGAATKIGKTSFVDDLFLFGALDYRLSNPDNFELDIDYFSLEINSQTKYTKCVSRQLWHDFNLIVDVNTILSRGEHYCSDEIYELVKGYTKFFEKAEDYLTIMDEAENPTGIYKYIFNKAEKRGKIIKKNVNKDKEGEPIWKFDKYVPNDPNLYWIVIIDHASLLSSERGFTTKQTIDKASQYLIFLKNAFNIIPVVVQQLTFDTDNDERFKSNRLTPTLRDFGDSKYTTRKMHCGLYKQLYNDNWENCWKAN